MSLARDIAEALLVRLTAAANKIPYFTSATAAGLLDFVDEDDMASNSATALPSQQSVKAYADSRYDMIGPVASTSGTTVDLTSIPAGVTRIGFRAYGVSTDGTSAPLLQIGASGTPLTTGYVTRGSNGAGGFVTSTAGMPLMTGMAAANLHDMHCDLVKEPGSDVWTMSAGGVVIDSVNANVSNVLGHVDVGGTLDIVRLTTVSGDTFDAGAVFLDYWID